jgi:hypothetical protein
MNWLICLFWGHKPELVNAFHGIGKYACSRCKQETFSLLIEAEHKLPNQTDPLTMPLGL